MVHFIVVHFIVVLLCLCLTIVCICTCVCVCVYLVERVTGDTHQHVRNCPYNELTLNDPSNPILPYANTLNGRVNAYQLWKYKVDMQRINILSAILPKYVPGVLSHQEQKTQQKILINTMRAANITGLEYNGQCFQSFIEACFLPDRTRFSKILDQIGVNISNLELDLVEVLHPKYGTCTKFDFVVSYISKILIMMCLYCVVDQEDPHEEEEA